MRIAILRILASRPDGAVALSTVTAELALLMSAGRWAGGSAPHVRRNAPPPDLFSSGFVIRVGECWRITPAGRSYLDAYGEGRFAIEAPAVAETKRPAEHTAKTVAAKPVVVIDNSEIDNSDLERLLPPLPPLRIATISRRPRSSARR